ncbi:MAG: hypothetical protein ORN85_10380, partial [Sediminibacterium sp.]|nr:hypothetical protein [Sediminibacterium sp.]
NQLGTNLSYQWFRLGSTSSTTPIFSSLVSLGVNATGFGTRPFSSVLTATASPYYLGVVISNPNVVPAACRTTTSDVSGRINVYGAPSIGNIPTSSTPTANGGTSSWYTIQTACMSSSFPLLTLNTPALTGFSNTNSNLFYQWYRATAPNLNGDSIIGGLNSSGNYVAGTSSTTIINYRPNTLGSWYYYFTVTNPLAPDACRTSKSGVSNTFTLNTSPILLENVSRNNQTVCQTTVGSGAQTLSVVVDTTGLSGQSPTYRWYRTTSSTPTPAITTGTTNPNTGTLITSSADGSGFSTPNFTPATTAASTTVVGSNPPRYFFAVITLSGCATISFLSGSVTVNSTPVIVPLNTRLSGASYCSGDVVTPLVAATTNSGKQWQWYSSPDSSYARGVQETTNSNDSVYIPNISIAQKRYYYCIINNTSNANCVVTSAISGGIQSFVAPLIFVQPNASNRSYCLNASVPATDSLTIQYTTGGSSTINFSWYIGNTGVLIPNSNNASYLPRTNNLGSTYYRVIINNGGPAACNSATSSNSGTISVFSAPRITTQPSVNPQSNLCQFSSSNSLFIADNNGGFGTNTYQWFSNPAPLNSGGTEVVGATQQSFSPPTNLSNTTNYYYVVVSNGGPVAAGCGTATSNTSGVVIVNPSPDITSQPNAIDQSFCSGGTATPLSITVNNNSGSNSTTQWYSNIIRLNRGGTLINGATNTTYNPNTNVTQSLYYYAVTTNLSGCSDTSSVSGLVSISPQPNIVTQPVTPQLLCQRQINGLQTLTAEIANGVPSETPIYQWYYSRTNNNNPATGILISGARFFNYTPNTDTVDLKYYFVFISFNNTSCRSLTSNTATVTVSALPTIINNVSSNQEDYCVNQTTGVNPLSVTATIVNGAGNVNYQWYQSSTQNINTNFKASGISTLNTYTIPTDRASTGYYFVIIANRDNTNCAATSNISGLINVNQLPVIPESGQPSTISQTYVQNQQPTPLVVNPDPTSGRNFGFQWYQTANPDNTNVTNPLNTSDATTNTLNPPTVLLSSNYYFAVVSSNYGISTSCYTTSNLSGLINVITSTRATINDTLDYSYCQFTENERLNVYTFSLSSGSEVSVQWYQSTSKNYNNAVKLTSDTLVNFYPKTANFGTYYYFAVIKTNNGSLATTNFSGAITIIASPTFNVSPPGIVQYCVSTQNQPNQAQPLAYQTSGLIRPTYAWYINSTASNSGGTIIPNVGDTPSYTPPINETGIKYYYVIATFSNAGGSCNTLRSGFTAVAVYSAPFINANPASRSTYCQGAEGVQNLTFGGSIGGYGIQTVRWYRNSTLSYSNATLIINPGPDPFSYLPPINNIDSVYYFATLSNGGPDGCNITNSSISLVITNGSPVITKQPDSAAYAYIPRSVSDTTNTVVPAPLFVSSTTGGGVLNYKWYS